MSAHLNKKLVIGANMVSLYRQEQRLYICLIAAGISYGDRLFVLISPLWLANAISYVGATPHFVDVCYDNICIDAEKLAIYLASITSQKWCNNQ